MPTWVIENELARGLTNGLAKERPVLFEHVCYPRAKEMLHRSYGSDLMNAIARPTYAGSTHRVGLR
jgi:hypothetical protein